VGRGRCPRVPGERRAQLPMEAITTLGAEGFFLPLVLLVFWCIDKPLGMDLALLLMISGSVNITLKRCSRGHGRSGAISHFV